jgi:hypothetical protein
MLEESRMSLISVALTLLAVLLVLVQIERRRALAV